MTTDLWQTPPDNFHSILFERVDPTRNEDRYYYLGWQPTLFDTGAVVRIFGRKGVSQRVMVPEPYPSLNDAWSTIRKHVRTRLRHGYRVVSWSMAEPTAHSRAA